MDGRQAQWLQPAVARCPMKNIQAAFWSVVPGLTGLWLLADTLLPRPFTWLSFRSVCVQYTGVVAIGAMSVALLLALRPRWLEQRLDGRPARTGRGPGRVDVLRRVHPDRGGPGEEGVIQSLTDYPGLRVLEGAVQLEPGWPGHKAGQFAFVSSDQARARTLHHRLVLGRRRPPAGLHRQGTGRPPRAPARDGARRASGSAVPQVRRYPAQRLPRPRAAGERLPPGTVRVPVGPARLSLLRPARAAGPRCPSGCRASPPA